MAYTTERMPAVSAYDVPNLESNVPPGLKLFAGKTNIELIDVLGHGNQATGVYLGNLALEGDSSAKLVAVKIYDTGRNVKSAQREAVIHHALGHHSHIAPLIVASVEVDASSIHAYQVPNISRVAMATPKYEYGSLKTWKETGNREPVAIVDFMSQAASAIEHAHNRGIIHRDIKPENLLLEAPTYLRLTDFGLAVLMGERTQRPAGTPHYMAPEQWEAKPSTFSDQYALGVTAYELLTGEPPFKKVESEDVTVVSVGIAHMQEDVPSLANEMPLVAALWPTLSKALAKNECDRFTSVTAFAEAMEDAIYPLLSDSQRTLFPGVVKRAQAVHYAEKAQGLAQEMDYEAAIMQYDLALKLNPNYMRARYQKEHVLRSMHSSEEAINQAQTATIACPIRENADYARKGYALAELGLHSRALRCFDEALARNFEDRNIDEWRAASLRAMASGNVQKSK